MALPKLVVWVLVAVLALFVLSAVVSAVFAALAFAWWLARTAIALAVVGGLLYGGYRLYDALSGDSDGSSVSRSGSSLSEPLSTDAGARDPVDDLQERYASGEISEAELERGLERQLADDELDSIDRELQRERS